VTISQGKEVGKCARTVKNSKRLCYSEGLQRKDWPHNCSEQVCESRVSSLHVFAYSKFSRNQTGNNRTDLNKSMFEPTSSQHDHEQGDFEPLVDVARLQLKKPGISGLGMLECP